MKILISLEADESSRFILEEALLYITSAPHAEIHLLTVMDMASVGVSSDVANDLMMDSFKKKSHELKKTAEELFGQRHIVLSSEFGTPIDSIIDKIKRLKCDLIIMGTHGRTGFDHLITGSVAEKILRSSLCNVLIIPFKKQAEKTA